MLSHQPYAVINWSKDGYASSRQFDDVYFDKKNGAADSHYTFITQSQFLERTKIGPLNIVETGFGSGLNFLQVLANAQYPVHYFSIEKYPLRSSDLAKVLKPYKCPHKEALLEQYAPYQQTIYKFDAHTLEIFWGDIQDGLQHLKTLKNIDIWFLDGFSPAKNPQMWPAELYKTMENHSNNNATVSTFTAAATVKNGLEEAGFNPQKVPGYGHKRQMLIGQKSSFSRPL